MAVNKGRYIYRPSDPLFSYTPGDKGYTFTRSSIATYAENGGTLQSIAQGVLRDIHYVKSPVTGLWERSTLLEGARTNLILYSEQFDNAAWDKVAATISPNAGVAPDGTSTADEIAFDGTPGARAEQKVTGVSAGVGHAQSVWLRADTPLTLRIGGSSSDPALYADVEVTTEWQRFEVTFPPATTDAWPRIAEMSGTVSSVYAWGAQLEEGPSASSYLPTQGGTAARVADALSYDGAGEAREQTMYLRFVDGGNLLSSGFPQLIRIGASDVRIQIYKSGSQYTAWLRANGTSYFATSTIAPGPGDLVELVARLSSAALTLEGAVNGGPLLAGSSSAPGSDWGGTWDTPQVQLMQNDAFAALTHVNVQKGLLTMEEMRLLAQAPSHTLLSINAEETLTGYTFTRASTATKVERA